MQESQDKQQKRIKKLLEVAVDGEKALLDHIFELEDRIDEIEIPEKGDKGDIGDSYELTEEDKKEIASLIEVPIVEKIIEKIIEKTEVIKEQPIVTEITKITNEIKEIAKSDTPEQIVEKINSTEKSIDFKTLKNYPDYSEEIKKLKTIINSTPAITTSFINGTRAKNINFSGATVSYKGDAANVEITADSIGAVSSVSNSDGTLTISPTTGAVVASRAAITGDVTIAGGSNVSVLATAQPAVHTWALAQTFTVAPTFSAMTSGSVLFAGTAGLLSQDNANFFYDDTANQLQMGSATILEGSTDNPITIGRSTNSYIAIYLQNLSAGASASTDLTIGNNSDNGNVSTGAYADFGINSSGFTGTGIINGPGDAYLFNNLEDLKIGTMTAAKTIDFFTNGSSGTTAARTRLTINDTGLLVMDGTAANPSIAFAGSTTTGLYEVSAGILGTSIAGVSRLSHSATTWSLNSSNGGTLDIGGASQYIDFGGTIVAGTATFQGLRTTALIWDMQVSRTNSFGLNNANTIGGSTGSLTLTTMSGARSGNVLTGSVGITITTSNAFEAREFNNGSSGTVSVTNNFGFHASQNMTTGATLNAGFRGVNTANATRWNLYMDGTAQNWLEGSTGIGINIPTAKLHVVQSSLGTAVAKFTSTATNDDPDTTVYQNRVATTNATVTTLATFATATDTSYSCSFRVVARRTGGTGGTVGDWADYEVKASVNNIAGTVTVDAVTTNALWESQAGWDATVTASGTNFLLRITGAANNNVTWHLSYSLISPLST